MYQQPMMPGQQMGMMGNMMGGMMPGMQPGMMVGMMPGMQPGMMVQQRSIGQGISQQEYAAITNAASFAYSSGQQPLSASVGNGIKQAIGGEWFVFISDENDKDYDFAMTSVKGGDFLSFAINGKLFQVCRIK